MSLLRRAARGGALLGAGQALATATSWLMTLILARLLTPEDFGLVGMATVILGFLAAISDLGLTAALIQRKELEDAHKDAAFWSSLAMGAGLFAASAAVAPLVARFYKEPRVTGLVIVSAVSLLLGPLSSTHASLFRRDLKFGAVAKLDVLRTLAGGVVSVAGALLGLGAWAIVAGPLAGHLISAVAYHFLDTSWRPGLRATRAHARDLFGFSLYIVGASAINYFSANVDYLIVGRVLGPTTLGTYTLAYQMMLFPLVRISTLFNQVMFPVFSSIQDKIEDMRGIYVGTSRSLAIISFPILAWVAVTAPELIVLVYGQRWAAAAPILQILSVAGALKSVGALVGVVYKSRGKPHIELYWNIAWVIGLSAAIIVGVRWGAIGVAVAISALCVPGVLFTEWLACRYIELSFGTLLRAFALPFVASGAAAAAGFLARARLLEALPRTTPWLVLRLATLTLLMLAVYAGSLRLLHPGIMAEVRAFIGHFRKER